MNTETIHEAFELFFSTPELCWTAFRKKNHIITSFVNSKQFPDTDSKGKKKSLYTGVTLPEHSESFLFEKKLFKK